MGLLISSEIVERRLERSWAESVPGVGSIFYFTLRFIHPDSNLKKDVTCIKQFPNICNDGLRM